MGSLHVVFVEPRFRCFPSLADRLEEPAIETPVSEDAVERLVMSVLPRASRIDEARVDAAILDPLLELLRNELRTVVALDRGRSSIKLNELIEYANDIERGQVPCTLVTELSVTITNGMPKIP